MAPLRRALLLLGAGIAGLGACKPRSLPSPPDAPPTVFIPPPVPADPSPTKEPEPPSGIGMPGAAARPDPKATLGGQITVAPMLRSQLRPDDVVFVVVRRDDGTDHGGVVLGVKRYGADRWPIAFHLDNRDAMTARTALSGRVVVSARVDHDGDATTREPGDLIGAVRGEVGQEGLALLVDAVAK